MPKRKPPRSRRKRSARPIAPPPLAAPMRPVAAVPAFAAPRAPAEPARERSITRFSARDYTYVRRELQRIVLLATAVLITIVVLSFFLP